MTKLCNIGYTSESYPTIGQWIGQRQDCYGEIFTITQKSPTHPEAEYQFLDLVKF